MRTFLLLQASEILFEAAVSRVQAGAIVRHRVVVARRVHVGSAALKLDGVLV